MSTRIVSNAAGRDDSKGDGATKHNTSGQQSLQFVNLPGDLKLDMATRRRVRSHVARNFRRRAKGSGSLDIDVNLTVTSHGTVDGGRGQRHRFRVGQQGVQEMGKMPLRKLALPKISPAPKDCQLPKSSTSRSTKVTKCVGGGVFSSFRSVQTQITTSEGVPGLSVQTSCSSMSLWDESYSASSQANNPNQGCTAAQFSTSSSENDRFVNGAKTRQGQWSEQKLHLETNRARCLDPFNTMPINDSSCRTQTLMHHFHLRIMASPLMMNPRKEWFSLAIQDRALFHVALSHAAGNLGLLRQRGDSIESLRHRMEAIRIINERLNNLSYGISDGTVGAVASIASYEATNGTLEGIRTHMDGLEQMVRMRGGVQQGGFSAHLRRLIAWADLNSANALSTMPRFQPLNDHQHLHNDQFAIDPVAFQLYNTPLSTSPVQPTATTQSDPTTKNDTSSSSTPDLANTTNSAAAASHDDIQALPPQLAQCFTTLRQLSRLLRISGPRAVIRMDHTWYSDMAYTLQRRLMQLSVPSAAPTIDSAASPATITTTTTTTTTTTIAHIERPCSIAALIYLECCIREIHPRSRIVEALVQDLHTSLLGPPLLEPCEASADVTRLLLWVLAVGVAASAPGGRDRGVHRWFVAQLAALCAHAGLGAPWDAAREALCGVLWPESESELTRALVWDEVEMAGAGGRDGCVVGESG